MTGRLKAAGKRAARAFAALVWLPDLPQELIIHIAGIRSGFFIFFDDWC